MTALFLIATALAGEPDPSIYFGSNGASTLAEWVPSMVKDVEVTSEMYQWFAPSNDVKLEDITELVSLPIGAPALAIGEALLPPLDTARAGAVAAPSSGLAYFAERLIASAETVHGVANYPEVTVGWRYWELSGSGMVEISPNAWEALLNPVYQHLAPDGLSYFYTDGGEKIGIPTAPGTTVPPTADTAIPGALPDLDPQLHGVTGPIQSTASHLQDEPTP